MKKCPFCAEDIQDAAIKCRYCGSMLEDAQGGAWPGASAWRSLVVWAVMVALGLAIWWAAAR